MQPKMAHYITHSTGLVVVVVVVVVHAYPIVHSLVC